jgi:hypothetical protein
LFKFANSEKNIGFEVITAVVMKSSIFCDITPSTDVSEEYIASILKVEE